MPYACLCPSLVKSIRNYRITVQLQTYTRFFYIIDTRIVYLSSVRYEICNFSFYYICYKFYFFNQAVSDVQSGKFQLVGVTAMFLASKYEEIYSPSVTDFLNMIKNRYTKADVFQCEWDILTKLGFCLARPIPLSFLKR